MVGTILANPEKPHAKAKLLGILFVFCFVFFYQASYRLFFTARNPIPLIFRLNANPLRERVSSNPVRSRAHRKTSGWRGSDDSENQGP
jgi:hypothetical protein